MWLKVGSYFERDEASAVASKLSECGARVEVKGSIEWDLEEKSFKKCRLSELEGDERRKWEEYCEILRELLANGLSGRELEREFAIRLFGERALELDPLEDPDLAVEVLKALFDLHTFLSANGIDFFEGGVLPEDPEVVIEGEGERVYMVVFFPVWEVFVEPVSLLRLKSGIEGEEGVALEVFSTIVASALFNEGMEASGYIDGEGFSVVYDGSEVVEELLRYLEKSGYVRRR
ncbi:MAG: hypothetical protein ABWW66_02580 [Archaeoglobaceae archaeon]